MNVVRSILAAALLFHVGDAYCSEETGAPPRDCEVVRGAWCILASSISFEHERPRDSPFRSKWTLRGRYWRDKPLVILEPGGCRTGVSDAAKVLSVSPSVLWEGKQWKSYVVRLKSDGSCDLKILSPQNDPLGSAFSASLTEIRVCSSVRCDGVVLAQHFPPESRAGW